MNEGNEPHAIAQNRHQLGFDELAGITSYHLGVFDVPCPLCSSFRRKKHLRPLRVWRHEENFATYNCVHCDAKGFVHAGRTHTGSSVQLKPRAEAFESSLMPRHHRRHLVRSLWQAAEPIHGTLAQKYLRCRGISCQLPDTLRFLPARGSHPPAMLAAFGIPTEPQPGLFSVADMAILELHITRLRSDGTGKADVDVPKIMLGPSSGLPIVCAAVNDASGLAICEGIEDALSLHQATGLGAWAAGSAGRLADLARSVPCYVESVTIAIDDDDAGRRHGYALARDLRRMRGRRFEILLHEANARAAA